MIALTGHRGFLGRAAMRALQREGHAVRVILGDVADPAILRPQLDGVHTVVHLAARHLDRFEANPQLARSVAECAVDAGVRRVIASSSAGVYGHGPLCDADESTPEAPDTALSQSRARAESILRVSGLDLVLLRTRFVYGPGDHHFLPSLHRAMAGRTVGFAPDARHSLVHVEDFASVVVHAATAELPPGPVVHVTDHAPIRLRALVERVCARLGGRPPRLWAPGDVALIPARALGSTRLQLVLQDQVLSSDRLRGWFPGFHPQRSL